MDVCKTVYLHSRDTKEELSSTGTSYLNRGEAAIVERLILTLIRNGASPEQIGVITPYIGQRNFLRTLLQRGPTAAEVEISSIDAFQGREKDIIIFSCVRSNTNRSIGFLADARRLNVALTRSRLCLFICGNADLLFQQRPKSSLKSATAAADADAAAAAATAAAATGDDEEAETEPPTWSLLRAAKAEFLEQLPVWRLLLQHYDSHSSIVTGPLGALRQVQLQQQQQQQQQLMMIPKQQQLRHGKPKGLGADAKETNSSSSSSSSSSENNNIKTAATEPSFAADLKREDDWEFTGRQQQQQQHEVQQQPCKVFKNITGSSSAIRSCYQYQRFKLQHQQHQQEQQQLVLLLLLLHSVNRVKQ
ncbi:hypothetical protein, conserved [Eimeria acervulina]|uniref:DNA2/NAM7 helicase-like C-terminal domain-containing protein n=1 Tax=Eimeria acervulina TaxID=5801 RepID=U6GHI6_EIMAC|nr:hypothetical protein, conserved [Eimeria acervulina]CDI78758.1 hypothetical protein, conserved [Eimeria acervulina]